MLILSCPFERSVAVKVSLAGLSFFARTTVLMTYLILQGRQQDLIH